DADKTQYVRAILDEIHRLDEIIRNLLNYARPPHPQIGTCLLADLSNRVIQLLSDEAGKKGIQIEVQDKLLHRSCRADGNQLTQALLNIVLNGIQACKKNDQIEIILSNEDADRKAYARIDVIDTGTGIRPEIRNRLFEPFVTTKTTGTGLGLAISQQIIEEHHGKISCRSLDKGTQFSIRLPVNMQEPSVKVD
ncbi:MAG: ATP-binding protein, partial [bacterium]|nr:ATP-binding protein [bacterium]